MYCVALQGLCSVAILLLHLLICYHLLLLFVRGALLTPRLISGTFNCFLPLLNLSVIPSFVCLTRAGQQPGAVVLARGHLSKKHPERNK